MRKQLYFSTLIAGSSLILGFSPVYGSVRCVELLASGFKMTSPSNKSSFSATQEAPSTVSQHSNGFNRFLSWFTSKSKNLSQVPKHLEIQKMSATANPWDEYIHLEKITPQRLLDEGLKIEGELSANKTVLVSDKSEQKWIMKTDTNLSHTLAEKCAADIYRILGAKVPEFHWLNKMLAKQYIQGSMTLGEFLRSPLVSQNRKDQVILQLKGFFVVDALLGNNEVIGPNYENVLVDKFDQAWRYEFGGSLNYQFSGLMKSRDQFASEVVELKRLRESNYNKTAAFIFSNLTLPEIENQVLEIVSRKADILAMVVNESVASQLENRINYLATKFKVSESHRDDSQVQYDEKAVRQTLATFKGEGDNLDFNIARAQNWSGKRRLYPYLNDFEWATLLTYTNYDQPNLLFRKAAGDQLLTKSLVEIYDPPTLSFFSGFDSIIRKMPLVQGAVYHRIGRNRIRSEDVFEDSTIQMVPYISASLARWAYSSSRDKILFIINAKRARSVIGLSAWSNEMEVIFESTSKFKVNLIERSADGSPTVIHLEEI